MASLSDEVSLVLRWMSKLGRCLTRQSKRICSKVTREKTVSNKSSTDDVWWVPQRNNKVDDVRDEWGSLRRGCDTLT